jgi:hypothetical protein
MRTNLLKNVRAEGNFEYLEINVIDFIKIFFNQSIPMEQLFHQFFYHCLILKAHFLDFYSLISYLDVSLLLLQLYLLSNLHQYDFWPEVTWYIMLRLELTFIFLQ